ncbi:hypothetical protein DAMA08_051110 [Martiniozyma asiatica (nom. inval.)]|nr:hypothetical protein DAMA08_051110 [Martiniozyma asiatica]
MPPKSNKNRLLLKVKRHSTTYFISLLTTDTLETLIDKLCSQVNENGGLRIEDEPTILDSTQPSIPEIPMDMAMANDTEESDEEIENTADTEQATAADGCKIISSNDIKLGHWVDDKLEIIDIEGLSSEKLSSRWQWKDFDELVFWIGEDELENGKGKGHVDRWVYAAQ